MKSARSYSLTREGSRSKRRLGAARQRLADGEGPPGRPQAPEEDRVIEKCWRRAQKTRAADAAATDGEAVGALEARCSTDRGEKAGEDESERLASHGTTPEMGRGPTSRNASYVDRRAGGRGRRRTAQDLELRPRRRGSRRER